MPEGLRAAKDLVWKTLPPAREPGPIPGGWAGPTFHRATNFSAGRSFKACPGQKPDGIVASSGCLFDSDPQNELWIFNLGQLTLDSQLWGPQFSNE